MPWISSTSSSELAWASSSCVLLPTIAEGAIGPVPWSGTSGGVTG
jgi:hypothetical protein